MELKLDHTSTVPLHQQAEQLLRRLIRQERYQKGAYLPSEVELAKQLNISRSTLRHAINKLVYEGLLVRKKGVGTVVNKSPVNIALDNWVSFTREMRAQGLDVMNFEISIATQNASQDVSEKLGVAEGTLVQKLTRVRGTGAGPSLLTVSYFHPRITLDGSEDLSLPLYDMLYRHFDVTVEVSKEVLNACAADAPTARVLDIAAGDPVLRRQRTVLSEKGEVIEYNITHYRADRFSYSIDIVRKT